MKPPLPAPQASAPDLTQRILIVDDEPANRDLLRDLLQDHGYETLEACDGQEGLGKAMANRPDLVLLDVMMPGLNGFEVCRRLKQHPDTAPIPILMVTALSERQERMMGIEAGANDFLNKPVDLAEVTLRVRNALYTKRLYEQVKIEQLRAENLLYNTLPPAVAQRLKDGETTIADYHQEITVLVADLIQFTDLMSHVGPNEVVCLLNELFSAFDALTDSLGLEKIKTAGDAYLVVGGLNSKGLYPARDAAQLAIQLHQAVARFNLQYGTSLRLRIGISTGPAIAGVIGRKVYAFDVWGESVNLAFALGTTAAPDGIQVDPETFNRLRYDFSFSTEQFVRLKNGDVVVTRSLFFDQETPAATEPAGLPMVESTH